MLCLGKKPPKIDTRTFKLSQYTPTLPTMPEQFSWYTALRAHLSIPMYLNNKLGCCVAAAAGHMIQQWNFYADHSYQPSDTDILKSYRDIGGYVPADPNHIQTNATDNGMYMLDFLKYWRNVGLGNHKIRAFVSVDWKNDQQVKAAIRLFGSLYVGLNLPLAAMWQQEVWTVTTGANAVPGTWGGHCVNIVGYDPKFKTCETWGGIMAMTGGFFDAYCEEAYCVLSDDWFHAFSNKAASFFTLEQLTTDLALL